MAYSLVRMRKSGGVYAGLTEALLVSLSWRQTKDYLSIEGCGQKPLEAAITKPVDLKSTWELRVSDLVSRGMLSFIVESSGTGTGLELREDSKIVGALEPVGAL
ncbi:hypothetical protein Tco_1147144 [Tanacetum coccineum]